VAGALWFLPQKGTRKHENLNEWVYAAGRFLCIFVPLCGYDSAGRWVVNQLPCLGCGVVGMILPKPHLVGSRRQKNDSAFNDCYAISGRPPSAKNASGWEHCIFCRIIFMQNDYPFCLLWWALFWGVWLGLCFLGRIISGQNDFIFGCFLIVGFCCGAESL
jgi:hypothetical protein